MNTGAFVEIIFNCSCAVKARASAIRTNDNNLALEWTAARVKSLRSVVDDGNAFGLMIDFLDDLLLGGCNASQSFMI